MEYSRRGLKEWTFEYFKAVQETDFNQRTSYLQEQVKHTRPFFLAKRQPEPTSSSPKQDGGHRIIVTFDELKR
jgi:hypothetical protein